MHSPYVCDAKAHRCHRFGASKISRLAMLLALVGAVAPRNNASPIPPQSEPPGINAGFTGSTGGPRIERLPTLPVTFEPNEGQSDAAARFVAHTAAGTVRFEPHRVVIELPKPGGSAGPAAFPRLISSPAQSQP